MTNVVKISEKPYDIYIGRKSTYFHLPQTIWRNRWSLDVDGTREEIVEYYRQWLNGEPVPIPIKGDFNYDDRLIILERLPELKGKTLGCWCKPKACHGDVLAELAEGEMGYPLHFQHSFF